MPLYSYRCRSGHVIEELRKFDRRMDELSCGICQQPATIVVTMPAKTAWQWGDTKWDGFYDRGLGITYRDKSHRESVMADRGLRPLEDGEVEAEQSRVSREHEQHNKNVETFKRVLEDTGSSAMAMAQTFPDPEV